MPSVVHDSPAPALDVETMAPELWIRHGTPPVMTRPHRHDDLEINVVISGHIEYLHGGEHIRLDAGEFSVFWGAVPHRLLDIDSHRESEVCWIHIPLTTVLGWRLPEHQLGALLSPAPISVPTSAVGRTILSAFRIWAEEIADEDTRVIAMLETQAIVRRALAHHAQSEPTGGAETGGAVFAMARFVLENFRDPLSMDDIARSVSLTTHYAMTAFRAAVGMTLGAYLIRCRVAEAQRLLITTDLSMTDVAAAAGFGSQSAFYEQFTRSCGRAPGAYRRALR
ncbi:helix-turn-helix domain-containing protein [Microbacterium indicum]|uniref:helix-turn-helix domain-containing protein n=1 Tax=Microbacterium indicum TaxID=358100 RepID=UPI000687EEA3|nr:helix-turn-helix domain-containing protein [Microbacterium indicum]